MGCTHACTSSKLCIVVLLQVVTIDTSAGQWSSLAPLPQSRDDMALAGLPADRMLVMGGETHANDTRDQVPACVCWPALLLHMSML